MTAETPRLTWALIAAVLLVGAFVYFFYPQGPGDEPEEGRVLAQIRVVEPVGPGFQVSDNFTIEDDYERIGLSYVLTVAYHVRAALIAPDGTQHNATTIAPDELRLDIFEPAHGAWTFQVWTLDEPEARIEAGDLYILGFGGPVAPQT